jgi:WhiB family transcriptional regulator, redox-sensing transcriptional regulator
MYARTDPRGPVPTPNVGQGQRRGEAIRDRRVPAAPGAVPQLHFDAATPCSAAPDLFFAEKPEQILQARALCLQCPARRPCLDGALQRAEPWGVWGGELILRGAIIPTKRARGRPRGVWNSAAPAIGPGSPDAARAAG